MRFILLIFLIYSVPTFAQQINSKQKFITLSDSARMAMPREKAYLHLDKTIYLAADTIWFKVYLVNASSNIHSKISGLIYVELISEQGDLMHTLALPTALGVTWGGLPLGVEKYKSGNYTLRAYTNWMQNFGDTHLFKKSIKILNGTVEELTTLTNQPKLTQTKNIKSEDGNREIEIDLQFLPEGGKWLVGRTQKIAFKAINEQGKGIEINGEILDSKQNKITHFSANAKGMGYFNMLAQANEKYTAKIKSNYGLIKDKVLPSPNDEGTVLQVDHAFGSDSLTIQVFSTIPYQDFIIIGQAKGMICFMSSVKSRVIKIAKSVFPTGVGQILLVDKEYKKLNERSFFVNHHDQLKISLTSNSNTYTLRDSIAINLNVVDHLKNPLIGTFSVAITDDNQVEKDSVKDENILTYLLLSSDLKGEIENPNYYFDNMNIEKHDALDVLMLTQGWVSYDWDLAKKPQFKAEKDYSISGKVSNILKQPSEKAQIILFGRNKSVLFRDTVTNKDGEFVFDNLPLLDSAYFIIQARNAKGRSGTLSFQMNTFKRPTIAVPPKYKKIIYKLSIDSFSKQMVQTKDLEIERLVKTGVMLREVKIVGKRVIPGSKNLNGPGQATQTLTEDEIIKTPKVTLLQLLQNKIKGFHAGVSKPPDVKRYYAVHGSGGIKLIFDGVDIDNFFVSSGPGDERIHFLNEYLNYYTAEDIKGIELMTGKYSRAYFQELDYKPLYVEYAWIEITTKTGEGPFLRKAANMELFKPITYGSKIAFYSPKYTSVNKADKKPDYRSTLYWAPHVLTDKDGNANFSFFSADKKGSYTVWVEGSDMQGNFGMKTMKLEIK